jgi:CMP/dCMP kinase
MGSQGNIIITITGDLGSGKSTVCDIIEAKYGFKRYSTGRLQRAIAEKYGMDTLELNKYAETHPEIDQEIDDGLRALSHAREDMIIDSRLAWHFVPDSYKVFLAVDIREAAKRVMADQGRGAVEHYKDLDDAVERLRARKESENSRYKQLYDVDCSDLGNYDLVIDSTLLSPDEIAGMIIASASSTR